MPVNFKLHTIPRERERAPAVMHFQQRTQTQARRGFTIDIIMSHYNAYVINVYGKCVLYFHLHFIK